MLISLFFYFVHFVVSFIQFFFRRVTFTQQGFILDFNFFLKIILQVKFQLSRLFHILRRLDITLHPRSDFSSIAPLENHVSESKFSHLIIKSFLFKPQLLQFAVEDLPLLIQLKSSLFQRFRYHF